MSSIVGCEVETIEIFLDEELTEPFEGDEVLQVSFEETRYPNLTFSFQPTEKYAQTLYFKGSDSEGVSAVATVTFEACQPLIPHSGEIDINLLENEIRHKINIFSIVDSD